MVLTAISSILSLIVNGLKLGWKILCFIGNVIRNRDIKKKYKEGSDAVEDGNVDEINKIITGRKD